MEPELFVGTRLQAERLTFVHWTLSTQAPVSPLGATPLRLMLTTVRPVRCASSLTRLPTNPLPPKMISFGGLLPPPPWDMILCHCQCHKQSHFPVAVHDFTVFRVVIKNIVQMLCRIKAPELAKMEVRFIV